MTDDLGKIYKEVQVITKKMNIFDELPKEIQDTINQFADSSYSFELNLDSEFDENSASKEAYGIVVLLYLTYISKDEKELEDIKKVITKA